MDDKENDLVTQLRSMCLENGSETNPINSAKIFHELGKIYADRSSHKICYIQSAVLLNAAVYRDPVNAPKVLNDLQNLCSKVLKLAKAENCDVNLIDISKELQIKIQQFREKVEKKLGRLPPIAKDLSNDEAFELEKKKIAEVEAIQNFITDEYSILMKHVAAQCADILGKPPCKFALVGMGSLARKEITPYSDFENIIVLEEKFVSANDYEYFRWFAVIFQIILVNLGESLIPSVGIPSLNNFLDRKNNWFYDKFTKSGVSFDGFMPHACKSPLGRYYPTHDRKFITELIKTASKMAEYIDTDEDAKNGYHLADVLTQTCFVYGEKSIYDYFDRLRKEKMHKQRSSAQFIEQLVDQVNEDKESFEIWKSLDTLHRNLKCDMKRIVYRSTTLFISALGKVHQVESSSSFQIVKELASKNLLSLAHEHKLLYAVAIACEVRLRVYLKERRANNQITKVVGYHKDYLTELFDLIGEKSTIDYFNITHSLQEGLPDFRKPLRKLSLPQIPFTVPGIYFFLNEYEKSIDCFRFEIASDPLNSQKRVYAQFRIGFAFFYLKRYREAIKEFLDVKCVLDTSTTHDEDEKKSIVKRVNIGVGECYRSLKLYDDALKYYQLAEPLSDVRDLNNLAVLHLKRKDYKTAGKYFEMASDVLTCQKAKDKKTLALLIHNSGRCLYEDQKYEDALIKLKESLALRKTVTRDYDLDEDIALTLYNIGRCYMRLKDVDEAKSKIKAAIRIQQRLPEKRFDPVLSDSFHYLGRCKFMQKKYEKALKHFKSELSIRNRLPAEQNTDDDNVANCYEQISLCYVQLNRECEAKQYKQFEVEERHLIAKFET